MKRLFAGLLLLAGLAVAFFAAAPLSWLSPLHPHRFLPENVLDALRPSLLPPKRVAASPPAPVMLDRPRPKWEGVKERLKKMVSVYRFDADAALAADVHLHHCNYLAAGSNFIATVDVYERDILIFSPELKFLRRWPLLSGWVQKMQRPISIAAFGEEVAALDRDGLIVIWNSNGKRTARIDLRGAARDFAFLDRERLLVVQLQSYPYLLAIFNRRGRKLVEFCPIPYPDSTEAEFLNEAYISLSHRGEAAVGFIYPYKLLFFNAALRPYHALQIEPEFVVQPPIFQRKKGRITQMVRQSVIYDIQWFRDRLYVLVAPEPAKPAQYMDVFSRSGEFLERFYLPLPALKLAALDNRLYFLAFWPKYRIEAFKIVKIADNP